MSLFLNIVFLTVQVIALYFAIKNYQYLKHTTERYFIFYMVLVVLVEIPAFIMSKLHVNNLPLYNTYMLLSFIFFFHWFYHILKQKRLILIMTFLFVAVYVYNLFNQSFFYGLLSNALAFGTIEILILVSILYLNILQADYIISYKDSRRFWIATGLLLFHIGFLPISFFQQSIDVNSLAYNSIMTLLNVIVYGSFIKGFSCKAI